MLVKTCVGITTRQPHIDQKPTELSNTQCSYGEKRYFFLFGSVRSFRKVVERRDGRLILFAKYTRRTGRQTCSDTFGADFLTNLCERQKSSSSIWYKDSRNIHQIRAEFWRRMDWHDIKNNVASEVHVERRFKSKEARIF